MNPVATQSEPPSDASRFTEMFSSHGHRTYFSARGKNATIHLWATLPGQSLYRARIYYLPLSQRALDGTAKPPEVAGESPVLAAALMRSEPRNEQRKMTGRREGLGGDGLRERERDPARSWGCVFFQRVHPEAGRGPRPPPATRAHPSAPPLTVMFPPFLQYVPRAQCEASSIFITTPASAPRSSTPLMNKAPK